jgi:hypothetical protein
MHAPGLVRAARSTAVAAVLAAVLAVIAAVLAAVMAAADAFADDGCGSHDGRSPRDRCPDHARAAYTSSR